MSAKKSNGGNVVGVVAAVAGAIVAMAPAVDTIIKEWKENHPKEPSKSDVIIPPLYDKGFPLTLDQVVEMLTNYGFKVMPHKLLIQEADARYKDCFDSQVMFQIVGGSFTQLNSSEIASIEILE